MFFLCSDPEIAFSMDAFTGSEAEQAVPVTLVVSNGITPGQDLLVQIFAEALAPGTPNAATGNNFLL